ncbi:MAG: Fe-S cluster assembly protein SufD, partial [Niveispirillum sp.]|nr:Fe-S cluster assembly protein SufD [Niveispirillum sp.]
MRDEQNQTARNFVEQVVALAPALAGTRADGLDRFAKAGLPSTRAEAWKFTNLRGLDKLTLGPAPDAATVTVDAIPTALDAPAPRLVFVAGQYR